MKTQRLREAQNIWDLAVQEYGSVEGIFNIIEDNDTIDNIDHIFSNGEEVRIDNDNPIDSQIRNFYTNRGLIPISGEEDQPGGDFNNDFNNDFNI